MYYLIDEDGTEFEATTLQALLEKAKQEASKWREDFNTALEAGEFLIYKGTKVKVKVIPPKYEEVKPVAPKKVAPKKVAAKKPVTKAKL